MQVVLDALAALLVVGIGTRCWSRAAGAIGGLLYALSPPHAFLGNLTVAAATDSFWFLLAAYGAVVMADAINAGRSPRSGCALVAVAALAGASMNSTGLVLPAGIAAVAIGVALFDRRYLRVAAALVAAQVVVLLMLTPWALRNQREYGQFSLVRGSFWQLAFAAWGELPNPWGLGFDDKEYFHWIEENCLECSPGQQQQAMADFLLSDVVASRPFPRHLANLIALRLPTALDVARTPDGVLSTDAGRYRAATLDLAFRFWNAAVPYRAVLSLLGLIVAVAGTERRWPIVLGLAPTIFLTCFSLVFYVELRKTVPGYGYLIALAGIGIAAATEWIVRRTGRLSRSVNAVAGLVVFASIATLKAQAPAVAAGGELHSVIVDQGGDVWGWGSNLYGQLGDGKRTGRYVSVPLAHAEGISDAVSVAAGSNHTVALTRDGTVWGWGDNSMGQLGDGTRTERARPVRVSGLGPVRLVSGGYAHSLALDASGVVWAWGSNLYGQLGSSVADSLVPVRVPLPRPMVAIASGWFFSVSVDDRGHVWSWGRNDRGELGRGTSGEPLRPAETPGFTEIQSVAAGHQHVVAVGRDGRVWCWGANDYGQIGVEPTDRSTHFVTRPGDPIAARGGLAVTSPRRVSDVVGRVAVAAADATLLEIADGGALGWGQNVFGQLGDGTFTTRSQPAPVLGLPPLAALAAGHAHAVGAARDGAIWSWGFGHYGQLGDGGTVRRLAVPRKVAAVRARELPLDLTPANAMVFAPSELGWTGKEVAIESGRLVVMGTAPQRDSYFAMARPVTTGPDTEWRYLYVKGRLRKGGLTAGVQVNAQWVFEQSIDVPGPFTIIWAVPSRMDAVAVLAYHLTGADLTSDLEIASWGWLNAIPR
jgi:alpha-tubulin suppressor-like RCC1 family protein